MNVLVTGGAGYIGSRLVTALLRAGHDVRVLDLRPDASGRTNALRCEFVQGSVGDDGIAAYAMEGIEAVYHLAWSFLAWRFHPEVRPKEERCEMQVNLFGTLNLLQAALSAQVNHFLFASSAVVYGPTGPHRVDEGQMCHPARTTLGGPLYGITKLACEQLCAIYQRRGLPVTVFRMHGVLGDGNLGQFDPLIRGALQGRSLSVVRGAGGEYVHVEDALRALLLALGNPKSHGEIFNLAGTVTYSEPELARHVVRTTGSASRVELTHDPTQEMVSVSVDKLRSRLGFQPQRGEFLKGMIRDSIRRKRG